MDTPVLKKERTAKRVRFEDNSNWDHLKEYENQPKRNHKRYRQESKPENITLSEQPENNNTTKTTVEKNEEPINEKFKDMKINQ
ncbi:unnamed protein product [Caenorhabditis angaria]|uniref:Uncharacterized protein n=1 Tax=Caenorhabditis angaria TaxID=860376 RepID=A0A9P1J116_9PELO|nr:unnamed protein product [Caenorhabditis angaria]